MLNFRLMSVSFSFEMSGRWFLAIPIFAFLSFKVIFATSKFFFTTDVCISHYLHILKRASPFAIDDDMINVALGSSIR